MATVKDLITRLETKVKDHKNFKIGKTGQSCQDRFNSEHIRSYRFHEEIGNSVSAKIIDDAEIEIIRHFKDYKNNDNEQEGGGEMTKSDKYKLYIVWN